MKMDDPTKIRSRLRRYERRLAKEKRELGHYSDGGGARYLVGPHYLLLGDLEGALKAFGWFEKEFPDDTDEAGHSLCCALALLRASRTSEAAEKLKKTALLNLYVLPRLLGDPQPTRSNLWLGSNLEWPEYADSLPAAYFRLWHEDERAWAQATASTPQFTAAVDRWIQIHTELDGLPAGERRSQLVNETWKLRDRPLRP